ncbi:MAG: hypothetical protein ACWGQW_06315 [bacterium]
MTDNPNPQQGDPFEEFMDFINRNVEGEVNQLFDPEQIITIRSTGAGGGDFAIPVNEPLTITQLLTQANLTVSQSIEYWVDGVSVPADHVVAPGTTITAVGQVKGG